jgi:hypothetical protein
VRRVVFAVLVLTAGLVVPSQTSAKDVTKLFGAAVDKVTSNPDFADAVVLEADGVPSGNKPIERASQIARWRFVFQNATPGSDFASVTIQWRRGQGFEAPVGHEPPFLEDVVIKRAPKMTLRAAIGLMADTGTREFLNVTLRRPLGPERTPPLYIFGVDDGFIAVNTKTGDVEPID